MIMRMSHKYLMLIAACLLPLVARGQRMTLDEAIRRARNQSVAALEARHEFVSTYWAYRSYKASKLPALYLYGNIMNYDRSIANLQSFEDGSWKYVSTDNLQNSIGLQVRQNVTFTGGTLTMYSDLNRIDQFGQEKSLTWFSQPLTVSYTQPLFAYNSFKWADKIEPKEYERGKRKYLESMEQLTINTVKAYYNLLLAQSSSEIVRSNYENTARMYAIARERLSIGSVTRDECLQLELKMLNDSISINESEVSVREAQMALNSLLGADESLDVEPVLGDALPDLMLDYEDVIMLSGANSSFALGNEINLLGAESDVARAKADRGISMTLSARFGLSQTAPEFSGVYRSPLDQEVVGLTFSVPIFDWGLGKGKVQKAKAAEDVVRAQIEQSENDHRRTIFTAVGQFNNQGRQCAVSKRAKNIAAERYALMMEKFRSGNASVTDLNNAQSESNSAARQYVTDVSNYWIYYYTLRQYTLYDFIAGENLEIDINEMVEQ